MKQFNILPYDCVFIDSISLIFNYRKDDKDDFIEDSLNLKFIKKIASIADKPLPKPKGYVLFYINLGRHKKRVFYELLEIELILEEIINYYESILPTNFLVPDKYKRKVCQKFKIRMKHLDAVFRYFNYK